MKIGEAKYFERKSCAVDKYTLAEESYKKGYRDGLSDGILAGEFLARAKARERLVAQRTCCTCHYADKTLWATTDPPQVLCTLTGKPRLANQPCSETNRKEV